MMQEIAAYRVRREILQRMSDSWNRAEGH